MTADKKAMDISILDMRKLVNFCDYFVICSGNTDRQVRAIADHINDSLKEMGVVSVSRSKVVSSEWVVYDCGDVVTHIFQKQARSFYNLEYLWQEAKLVSWE